MKKFRQILRRLMVILIVFTVLVNTLYMEVRAEANDIINVYISMAAGKQMADVDVSQLSDRDLQFLGVYLSNFFVPFGTELGETTDEVTQKNKENMVKALQKNMYFSESLAKSLVETVLGLSRSSATELKLYVSEEYQKELVAVDNAEANMPLNYYTALCGIFGGLPRLAGQYDNSIEIYSKIRIGKYKWGYFCYEGPNGVSPVFDFKLDMSELTPSVSAFIKCLESADITRGYGFNFFDYSSSEKSDDDFKKLYEEYIGSDEGDNKDNDDNIETPYKESIYGARLRVDCFGNIILMGANHQYVAVPGCMNPYTWVEVDSNGSTVGEGLGGTAYNMINIPSMSLGLDDGSGGNSLITAITSVDASGNDTGLGEEFLDSEISVTIFEDKYVIPDEKQNAETYLQIIIKYASGQSGDVKVSIPRDISTKGISVEAKPSVLYKIDPGKITSDALNNAEGNSEDIEAVKNAIGGLASSSCFSGTDDITPVIQNELSKLHEEGSKRVNNEISYSVGILRRGVLDTRNITLKLTSIKKGDNMFSIRRVRGKSDNGFGAVEQSQYRKLAALAERGLVAANKGAMNYYNAEDGGIRTGVLGYENTINVLGTLNTMFNDSGSLSANSDINIFDSFVYIDDLGAYHIDSSSEPVSDFRTFNVEHYLISSNIDSVKDSINSWGGSPNNGFTNASENSEKNITIPEVSGEALIGIYITYAYAGLYNDLSSDAKKDTIGRLGYKLNNEALPEIPDKALILSQEAQSDQMLDAIKGWLYYLLHPTDGLSYFRIWITNKLNSFLLGWHDDMVGTNGTGSINGTTRYRGFSGYVTTPELTDLEWTSSLLNAYNSAIPFLLVIMLLLMLGSYIVGMLSLQKAIIGFLIFAVAVSLPPTIINSAVGTANRFASSLYGEKFTYWALIQHESYSDDIDAAAKGESYSNYLRTLYEKNAEAKGNQGTESVMLKWQAPKKMASLVLTESDRNAFDSLTASALIAPLINATYSGESYLDKEDAVYLYRSYIDIANFSRYIHRGLSGTNSVQPTDMNLTNDVTDSWDESLKNTIHDYATEYEKDRSLGYTNLNGDGSTSGTGSNILRVRLPLSSRLVTDALAQRGTIKDLGIDDYVGIDQRAFNFSIPLFNVEGLTYSSVLETNGYTMDHLDADYSGLAAYGLMSENPFYYFSWYLYETGLTEDTTSGGYKKLLLGSDNAGFFYNTKGNSEMKDFMDLKSLFTYVIPYLKQGNDLVHEWNDTYGIFVYEGVPTEENLQDTEILNNPELRQKYWHNLNVARLYNVYTPWVDIMYDCSYAKPEKISYLGDDYLITDPINPATYPEDRPMIFSKSEMLDYGMSIKDLTKVEKLILECEEGMQERLFKLLNYHTFNDVVLNTAAAMNCAFEFNETFSENTLFGVNNNIYPQAYELKDFSYDAFLRFILSNTTGDSMVTQGGESFYKGVVDRSSMTTVIVMLVLDVLAMYVIPGCKVFFIVGIFLLAFLLIVVTAFRVDKEQKFIMKLIKSFILPVLKFLGITCGMALVISWFMGEGNTSITGSMDISISVGDPVIVMLLMIALNCFVVYLYFKILKGILNDIKSNGKMAVSFVGGVVASIGGALTSMVTGGKSGSRASSGGGSGSSAGSGSSSSKGSGGLSNARAQERGIFAIGKGNREERISSTSDRADNDIRYDRKTGRKIANPDENKTKTEGKSKDIDEKAKRGLSKLFSNDKKESSNEEGSKKTKGEGNK